MPPLQSPSRCRPRRTLYASAMWRTLVRSRRVPLRVIFDRRDAPTRTVGLPPAAERLDLLVQSGSSTFESFRAHSAPTTEESGQLLPCEGGRVPMII
jgi:hypothetical protein